MRRLLMRVFFFCFFFFFFFLLLFFVCVCVCVYCYLAFRSLVRERESWPITCGFAVLFDFFFESVLLLGDSGL